MTIGSPFPQPYIEADRRTTTPAFFESMQIPLLRGRMFTADDAAGAPPVIIVDEGFAKRIWPDRDPLGQRLAINTLPNSNPPVLSWRTVVGVVGHVKNNSLDQLGREQTYVPIAQTTFPILSMYLTIRTAATPTTMAAAVQRVVRGLDPSVPAYEGKTMSDGLNATVSSRRFNMLLLVAFGALALALAAIGTYGVIAYSASQRTQEIGVRMALGASQQDVLRMVVGGGMRLAVGGVLVGVALALAAGRIHVHAAFRRRFDGSSDIRHGRVGAAGHRGTCRVGAARRATRVHPMVALRLESSRSNIFDGHRPRPRVFGSRAWTGAARVRARASAQLSHS